MPLFEYTCDDCKAHFEALVGSRETPTCPHCHSTDLRKELSVFAVGHQGSSHAASFSEACASCPASGGPQCCGSGFADN